VCSSACLWLVQAAAEATKDEWDMPSWEPTAPSPLDRLVDDGVVQEDALQLDTDEAPAAAAAPVRSSSVRSTRRLATALAPPVPTSSRRGCK
jgi:hypothetical protein